MILCPDCKKGYIENYYCDNCGLSMEDIKAAAGIIELHSSTPTYVVTGVLTDGRRFKAMRFKNAIHAYGINLYKGSIWEEVNGRRRLIHRV